MGRRILSACFGVPAWGDGNAWAYGLHGLLASTELEATLVHLLTDADVFFFRYLFGDDFDNPHHHSDVRRCIIEEPLAQPLAELTHLIDELAPEILVAWGTTAARILRRAAPKLPLVLMVCRCERLQRLIADGAVRDFLGFQAGIGRGVVYRVPRDDAELATLRSCDLAVVPSALAQFAHVQLFRSQAGKVYARPLAPVDLVECEATLFAHWRRPFDQRDVDVVFVAQNWASAAANLALVKKLCAALPSCRVHLVGEGGSASCGEEAHGVLSRSALYELLGRAKMAVFPGLADAAPHGMFEAAAMGCNIVASPNCSFVELCHDDLRVRDPAAAGFVDRIQRARERPFADQRARFRGDSRELIETLAVF